MFITNEIKFYDQQELHQSHDQNSMQGNLHTSLSDVTLLPPQQHIPLYSPHHSTSYSIHRNVSAGKRVIILATETASKWVTQGKGNYKRNQH